MSTDSTLDRGREAFRRRAWAEAFRLLEVADRESSLEPDDLERLATAAYLAGRDAESVEAWARAHQEHLIRGEVERAARAAFWLAFGLMSKGDRARAGGWLGRAGRLLDRHDRECVEQGYLLLPAALGSLGAGEAAEAHEAFQRAATIGVRFADSDLETLGRLGQGQALIRLGEVEEGVALLDEAMAAVEAGELSPVVSGTVYCAVIETCQEIFDLRRAAEWTEALTQWCESQPELVPYRGQCLVRRAEILQLRGEWPNAREEARRACERLSEPPGEPAAGAAFYQRGELLRLAGEFASAEEAYREAARWGRKPQPGLALLRLAQGRVRAAVAAIRRVMEEETDRVTRSHALPAFVEIMLASDEVAAAGEAAEELAEIAAELDAPFLRAWAEVSRGSVHLARGDARQALDSLRRAGSIWEGLETPYQAARVRVLIALACRALGDDDTAELELDAARWAFRRLGARPDVERVEALAAPEGEASREETHGLTPRELEVLQRVAAGDTNKEIGGRLGISERTVERHVSNICHKLRVSTRTAATAFAYEHDLV